MAWTNIGYDGTINESQWATLSGLLGNSYVAAANGDCKVTAVSGARSVSVAAGTLYGDGVASTNSAPETVALTTPVNGQWYLVCLRRTWASNTSALVAVAGATTSTTIPTSPPSTYPTINTNVGVLTDQPIAWAWCNSATTDVVVSDLRQFPVRTQESTGNAIINGDFSINQRAFSSTTSAWIYSFDRWRVGSDGGTTTHSAQAFTIGAAPLPGYESANFARIVTSGQSSTVHYAVLNQPIEDVRTFAGQTVTISFWAKAGSGTPKIAASLEQAYGGGGSSNTYALAGTVTISQAWTRYSLTVAVPSIAGKTIGTASALSFNLAVSAGSGVPTAQGIGVQNNTFDIWGIQVEKGSTATPFKTAAGTKQGELAACQRYYWRTYGAANIGQSTPWDTSNTQCTVKLPVTMRVKPHAFDWTGILSNYGINNHIYRTPTAISMDGGSNSDLVTLNISTSGAYSLGQTNIFYVGNGAYLGFSAEL